MQQHRAFEEREGMKILTEIDYICICVALILFVASGLKISMQEYILIQTTPDLTTIITY